MSDAARKLTQQAHAEHDRSFYERLVAFDEFSRVTDTSQHENLPDGWDIVISDVIGSTKAIQNGRYKDVNMVGAACIAAITNIDRSIQLPFVFGGDGATFATPRHLREQVKDALSGARALARDSFNLDLRIGIVPVEEITALGHWVRVGKYRMSPMISQPAFSGRGWEIAERIIKDPEKGRSYIIDEAWPKDRADFAGLACRWNGIPSTLDCKLALLVVSADQDPNQHAKQYAEVMRQISQIFGEIEGLNPIRENLLNLSFKWSVLIKEAKVQTAGMNFLNRFAYMLKLFFLSAAGTYIFAKKIDAKTTQWSRYKSDFVNNSDYKKFDGMLRMVIDATFEQKAQLEKVLEQMYQDGQIMYGTHASPEAIVTCLVEDFNGHHTHFVDGSDGGYAMAAVQLKKQIKERLAKGPQKA